MSSERLGAEPARRAPRVDTDGEWHSRGYLPHWEGGEVPQHITFCLNESLPRELLDRRREELSRLPETEQAAERRRRIEAALDAGHGTCWLRRPEIAAVVQDAVRHFDGARYRLHAWAVMPNHVHVLATPLPGNSLSSLAHSWKTCSARKANRLLGRRGQLWQREYFDRAVRDEQHFERVVAYIRYNPVKAGLCDAPEK